MAKIPEFVIECKPFQISLILCSPSMVHTISFKNLSGSAVEQLILSYIRVEE